MLFGHNIEEIIRIEQKETMIEKYFNSSSNNDLNEGLNSCNFS